MIDVEVELSQAAFYPGQIFESTITLLKNNPLAGNRLRSSSDANKAPYRHARRHSRSTSGSYTSGDVAFAEPKSPLSPTMPQSPPSTTHAADENEKSARPKSKSVSFSPLTSPTHARRPSHSKMPPVTSRPSVLATERLMIVYAQITGTFTAESDFVQSEHFETLRGIGVDSGSGGGVVSDSTITNPRWSFSNWTNVLTSTTKSSLADLRHAASGKSMPILAMPPTIVDVELLVRADEAEQRVYKCALPANLPPTFSGKSMSIAYTFKLTAQREDNTTTMFECPIQITTGGAASYEFTLPHIMKQSAATVCQTKLNNDKMQSSVSTKQDFLNFLEALDADRALPSPIQERSQILPATPASAQLEQRRDRGEQFDISRSTEEHVCKAFVSRSSHVSGQTISGSLNFRAATLQCFQCTISLQSNEVLDAKYAVMTPEVLRERTTITLSHTRIITAYTLETSFELAIPSDAVASFKTVPLSLQYSLLFKFIIHNQENLTQEIRTKHGIEAIPVEDVLGEMFECRIPITVLPQPSHLGAKSIRFGHL